MILNNLLLIEMNSQWLNRLSEEIKSIIIIQTKGLIVVIVSQLSEEGTQGESLHCLQEIQIWKKRSQDLVLQMIQYQQLKVTLLIKVPKFQHLKNKRKEWWRMHMDLIHKKSNKDLENLKGLVLEALSDQVILFKLQWYLEKGDISRRRLVLCHRWKNKIHNLPLNSQICKLKMW